MQLSENLSTFNDSASSFHKKNASDWVSDAC